MHGGPQRDAMGDGREGSKGENVKKKTVILQAK